MDIEYIVKRSSKRKKLTITVERDRSIVVHVPENISEKQIEDIVNSKRQWIYEKMGHPQKYTSLPHAPGKELVNGESLLYLGRQYQVEVMDTLNGEVQFDQRFYLPVGVKQATDKATLLKQWYIKEAKEKIVPRVFKYASDLGVNVGKVKIVNNRYRWGSCTVNDNINISWRLIMAPMFVVDYIVVHELAHLIESNHTPVFWNIVSAQSPRMEKAKQWLKENGQILEDIL